jgi:hypothetical protein
MAHSGIEDDPRRLHDIVAPDEERPGWSQQLANGLGGLMLLLVTGMVIVLLVLWRSP